MVAEFVE